MAVRKTIYCIVIVALVAGFGWPLGSQAGTSVINNDIQVEADTGGNNANRIEKGEAKASVDIKTEVNGKTIEDTSIREKDKDSLDIKVKSQVTERDGVAEKETTTSINGDTETSGSETRVQDDPGKKKTKDISDTLGADKKMEVAPEADSHASSGTDGENLSGHTANNTQATTAGEENRLQAGTAIVVLSSFWDLLTTGFNKIKSFFA